MECRHSRVSTLRVHFSALYVRYRNLPHPLYIPCSQPSFLGLPHFGAVPITPAYYITAGPYWHPPAGCCYPARKYNRINLPRRTQLARQRFYYSLTIGHADPDSYSHCLEAKLMPTPAPRDTESVVLHYPCSTTTQKNAICQ